MNQLCQSHINISTEVAQFLKHCTDVKEESITDFLVWKWSELDKRFKHININTFTRQQENKTTGADYELELWLVGENYHFPLVIQAKKFIKDFDSYHAKLNYPKKTQEQLNKLLDYAKSKGRIPFYCFYSLSNEKTQVKCLEDSDFCNLSFLDNENEKAKKFIGFRLMRQQNKRDCYSNSRTIDLKDSGIFIADAYIIKKEFADKKTGTKISKNELLSHSIPFHCILCCFPYSFNKMYCRLEKNLFDSRLIPEDMPLPNYVNLLLTNEISAMNSDELAAIVNRNELYIYRHIAVYNMRNS